MSAEIPIDETGPFLEQVTDMDGSDFILTFHWNEREQRWYMDLADSDGLAIVAGIKLVANWQLLRLVVGPRRPAGELVLQDTSGGGTDPRLGDLGTRVKLIYFSAAEVEAGAALNFEPAA